MENKQVFFVGELKELDNEKGVFEGYASTFGNVDAVNDTIERGAFIESLKRREPKVLWQHETDKPVGKMLEAREDSNGLYVKVKLSTGSTYGKDAYALLKDGVINTLSIGFQIIEAEYNAENGNRIIKEVELFEFSLVTFPADEHAKIMSVKTLPKTEREFEKFLCNAGFSRKQATAIALHGIKGCHDSQRDADNSDDLSAEQRDADEEVKTLLNNLLQSMKGTSYVGEHCRN